MDILNLSDAALDKINQLVKEFIPAAQNLLTEKTDSAAALTQERLNAVWDIIFSLPIYRDLKMDEPCNYHTFQRLLADEEKWAQVQDPISAGYFKYQGMMIELACFAEKLRGLRQMIAVMAEKYFEPLKRKNSAAYAEACSYFYARMLSDGARVFGESFNQNFSMEVNFVPMMYPSRKARFLSQRKRRSAV